MRSVLHHITAIAIFFGVILLNALIYQTVLVRLSVSKPVRHMLVGLVLVSIIVVVWVLARRIGRRSAAQRRAAFLSVRLPLSNEDFFRELKLEDERERRVARVIRAAVAREYRVPAEMLHPSDDLYALDFELTSSIVLSFEPVRNAIKAELGSEYDWWFENTETTEGRGLLEVRTFGEFVQFYLKNLDRLTAPKQGAVHR